jgi:MFS superfamily sulfate permease-like transporter
MKNYIKNLQADLPAALVVFLVALPLCLGIALGSKVPLFSGIIAGVVGGIAIGFMSGSPLSVSGPAAGLTAIVAAAILKLPTFESFLLAVVIAGFIQLILGFLKAGILGDYVPNSVIKGMLAAIGIILILKQLPHLVGFDKDFLGDETFSQADNENTFTEIVNALGFMTQGPVLVGLISMSILILFEIKIIKQHSFFKQIPAPVIVVAVGILANELFSSQQSMLTIQNEHLVNLPVTTNLSDFIALFSKPDFTQINNLSVWSTALTLAIVASLETLLSIEAIDKIDPYKRVTPTNRELKAQGIGNMISGLLGGLPVTSVIVRSSANVNAGGMSKASSITHGILLFVSVLLIPNLLNKIPLSALAAILIFTGYKLTKIPMIKEFYYKGWNQFIPFIATVIAILLSDLLIGIFVGAVVAIFFMIRSNFRSSVLVVNENGNYLLRLRKDVSFLNKPIIKSKLESIPANSYVIIDSSRADFIDKDIIDVINEYKEHANLKNITVEIKKNAFNKMQDSL